MTRRLVFHVIGDHEYPIPSPDTTSGRSGHKQAPASLGGDAPGTHVHTTEGDES